MKTEKIEVILSNHDGDEIPAFVTFDVFPKQKEINVIKVEFEPERPVPLFELSEPEWDIKEAIRASLHY